ncbi:CRISPR-associated endonuclease Cas2 [Acidilobus sp.]|uniref:CRISPR-associated endonuclease Cas2 n=1 Tax=Acidilobus sp. TaxID=1872109 RepID=UPI003D042017
MLLVIYDVSDNSRRLRLSKELERMGLSRVQRSAFVGPGGSALFKELSSRVVATVNRSDDVVHMVRVSEAEWASAVVIGRPVTGPEVKGYEILV